MPFIKSKKYEPNFLQNLAMYMNKKWWQLDNELCTKLYLEKGNYIPLEEMIYGKFYEMQDKTILTYHLISLFGQSVLFVKCLLCKCGLMQRIASKFGKY